MAVIMTTGRHRSFKTTSLVQLVCQSQSYVYGGLLSALPNVGQINCFSETEPNCWPAGGTCSQWTGSRTCIWLKSRALLTNRFLCAFSSLSVRCLLSLLVLLSFIFNHIQVHRLNLCLYTQDRVL